MALLSLVLCDLQLNPIPQEWAMEQVLSATIVMEELDQFSNHSITVSGSFRENLALLNGMTAVQIIDGDIGTIAYGLLVDPEDQITAEDQHTITLNLPNITADLLYTTTGQGWVAGYFTQGGGIAPAPPPRNSQPMGGLTLKQIVENRLGTMRYGWFARMPDYGNFPFVLRFEDATILGAFMQTAQATFGHVRQAHDLATGLPVKGIEIGQFGANPTVQIVTPDGGNAQDILTRNPDARLAQTVTRHPADFSKIITTLTPLGGGSGINQVRMRRLFRILFDPTYEHYAGNDSRKLNSYFPEWDAANFPIHALYDGTAWRPARVAKGDTGVGGNVNFEIAARLDGGADGYEYTMSSNAALFHWNQPGFYPHCAEFRAPFTDSTFSYTDSDIYNQEMTERALYVAAKAQLSWWGFPQQTITVTTVGNRKPPRAGDLVSFDLNRIGYDVRGAFMEFAEQGTYQIVSIVRQYGDVVVDTWTVTNNGKHPPDPTSQTRDATRGMVEALRLIPTTQPAIYSFNSGQVFLDAGHAYTQTWELPSNIVRVQVAHVTVQVWNWRQMMAQGTSALNYTGAPDGDHNHHNVVLQGQWPLVTQYLPDHQHNSPIPNHAHGGFDNVYESQAWTDQHHGHTNTIGATGSGSVTDASSTGNVNSRIDSHQHSMTVGSGGNPGTGDSTGILYVSGSSNPSYGGAYIQGVGRGATINTAYYTAGTNSGHGHGSSFSASKTPAGTGGIDGIPANTNIHAAGYGPHGYPATEVGFDTVGTGYVNNLTNGTQASVTITGTLATFDWYTDPNNGSPYYQGGRHLHAYTNGLFDVPPSPQVSLEIDYAGNGSFIPLTPTLGAGQSASFDIIAAISTHGVDGTEALKGNTTPVFRLRAGTTPGSNPLGIAMASFNGFAIVEIAGVGSQILYA
jgi:hypothetical protein